MKQSKLFITCFLLFTSTFLHGQSQQNTFDQQHHVGFHAGTNMTPSGDKGYRTDFGGTLGISYGVSISPRLQLGAEMNYDMLRQHFERHPEEMKSTLPYTQYEEEYTYQYFTFPMKIQYTYGEKVYGFAAAGIMPSFLTESNYTIQDNADIKATNTGSLAAFSLGALGDLGAGYRISETLALNARIRYSMRGEEENYDFDFKTYHFLIGLRYSL